MVLALVFIADAFAFVCPVIASNRVLRCCWFLGYFRSPQVNIWWQVIPTLRWIINVGRWVSINFWWKFFPSFSSSVAANPNSVCTTLRRTAQFQFLFEFFNVIFTSYWIFISFFAIISIPLAIRCTVNEDFCNFATNFRVVVFQSHLICCSYLII